MFSNIKFLDTSAIETFSRSHDFYNFIVKYWNIFNGNLIKLNKWKR